MIKRALRVMVALARRGHGGAQVDELAAEHGCSRATLFRDFQRLRDVGLQLEACDGDSPGRVRLAVDFRLPMLGPDSRERLALDLIRNAVPTLEDTFVTQALDGLRPAKGPTKHKKTAAQGPHKTGPAADTLETIVRAIDKKRRLTFRYRGTDDERDQPRAVDPIELRLLRDQLYLVAWDLDRDGPRTFKPMRMHAAFVSPEPSRKRDVDVDALLTQSVRVWNGASVPVVVRLAKSKARFAAEWPLHPLQRLETQPDGSTLVCATVSGLVEATRWVLSWGADACVIEPTALRDMVVAELEGALAGYGGEKKRRGRAG